MPSLTDSHIELQFKFSSENTTISNEEMLLLDKWLYEVISELFKEELNTDFEIEVKS